MGSKSAASAASMKVHHLARGLWAASVPDHHVDPSALSLAAASSGGCKRLRPLAPRLPSPPNDSASTVPAPFDLKSFIRPESGPHSPDGHVKRDSPPVETHPGGTRWNPTQEQIGILEMLYRGGMRTPNAQQIEQITAQLRKYGKIEGKNVFYWFQNHKARERQKQKRNNLGHGHCPRTSTSPTSPTADITAVTLSITTNTSRDQERDIVIRDDDQDSPYKRKCRSWAFEFLEEDLSRLSPCRDHHHQQHQPYAEEDRTLELFPLHPEGR
ncbi:hypothetical protein SAY86_028566 [Trapa natans]|uniref:Homeobox domain-containing protein n=1 Tax=Trapa natans TaxID=22666 RepID=A0AAN7MFN8_TRANT|nr:hypothetical protein SAY86_028566 [Trapa natans]